MSEFVFIQGASRGLGAALVRVLLATDRRRRVFATCRTPRTAVALAQLASLEPRLEILPLDVTREESIAAAADLVRERAGSLDLLVNVAGVLHGDPGLVPEKRLETVSPDHLRRVFEVNAFGPLLVAKHFHPLLAHERRAVLANVSARVGSIGDNRAGGWYAYRGSKAAQNMFTRTIAIELRRRAPNAIVVAVHPGTVDTDLSRPFQRSVPPGQLFDGERAARQLIAVLDALTADQSGSFVAWDGSTIPW
ncbi:MAG: SDR family oxidoreductase [Deltaproteobacteria bacterium]|nr:SDR family oxidoreductase [Deltaproteobacteria bacterium]